MIYKYEQEELYSIGLLRPSEDPSQRSWTVVAGEKYVSHLGSLLNVIYSNQWILPSEIIHLSTALWEEYTKYLLKEANDDGIGIDFGPDGDGADEYYRKKSIEMYKRTQKQFYSLNQYIKGQWSKIQKGINM